MEPPQRRDAPLDDLLEQERRRWERIAEARTPEELADALRAKPPVSEDVHGGDEPPPSSRGRRVRRGLASVAFPLIVIVAIAVTIVQQPEDDAGPQTVPTEFPEEFTQYGVDAISRSSTGPVRAIPFAPVVAVVSAVGGVPVPVTAVGEGANAATWRPDGGALLVSTQSGLVELPVDRSGLPQWALRRRIGAYRGASPRYSGDGARIAYLAVLADIVVGDRAGARPRLVLDRIEWREPLAFDWAVDGRMAVAAGGSLAVVTPDGTSRIVETALPTIHDPSWAPDGHRIAYTQLNPRPGDGISRVEVVDLRRGREMGSRVGPRGSTTGYPAWSPDGGRIAYARFFEGTWDIFVLELASGNERRVTRGRGDEIGPAWSPDGKSLAFIGNLFPAPRA